MITWTVIFLIALFLASLVEIYLMHRQRTHVERHKTKVPTRFASVVSLNEHQKAAEYTLAKLSLANWGQAFSILLLLAWTLGGGLHWLDVSITTLGWSTLMTGVAVMLAFFVVSSLLELPIDAWKTFKLEARFGFNKSTWGLYLSDQMKQFALLLVIGMPLTWVLLWLMQESGGLWWLYAWLVWTGFSMLMLWVFPTWIAPLFNRFEPLPEGEARVRIEALLERCGFSCGGLFVMDGSKRSSHGNAYFTGLGKAKRIVFFDTLLNSLELDEAEAVLAHELGHFHHGHVKKRIFNMIIFSFIGFVLLGWLAQQPWFYTGLAVAQASNHAALLLFMLVMPVFSTWFSPLMNLYSRKHEFQADAYAAKHSSAEALVRSLVKLYRDNAATLTSDALYSAWHDSHPPAPMRIAELDAKSYASNTELKP